MEGPRPRRWSETLGGIRWLPRLIDKARMSQRGELGAYLLGNSPVDMALLRRLGVTTAQFAAIVAASSDDEAVLAALRARGYDEGRLERWSQRLPMRHPWIIGLIDLDEGYLAPTPAQKVGMRLFNATEGFLMGLVRRILKAP